MGIVALAQFTAHSQTATKQPYGIESLVGRWDIIGTRNEGWLDIVDRDKIVFSYRGERKSVSSFDIDFSKNPIWFDFEVKGEGDATMTVKSIMEVISDDLVKWQVFIDEDRSDHFTADRGELFYLKRMKMKTVVTFAH